ncbi:PD40 domain-containing protein [Calothrix anomala FACHB-343]|uniref:PD40 domain-containing protein n=3 Tax=Calotrichaceae TaxID=2661849 RepID=A0ABR8ABC1_9CYAN|nr:PD40 domain-containing protein [Calothrix parietina FACHB-288]MBD2225550.1 PD40 domain-containing protein [Calothrix anomala FACHB-343]
MTFEQAMLVLDLVLQQKHLSNIQELVLRQSWEGYTYAQIAERSGYDDDYIRDVGYRLWQTLSRALGENVNKSNIKSVLRRRYVNLQPAEVSVPTLIENPVGEKQPKTSLQQDWGEAIDVSVFYGRMTEQSKLQQWIVNDRCRLLALLGMGGIGKTALSVKLAQQLQDNFDYVIWRSLRNAPPIVELLKDIIAFVSEGEAVNLPETVEAQISGLMNYLAAQRCLIVLDNVESVLATGTRSGRYRLGYEGYGQLLRRLGDERHQSCLLITSREKPIGFTAREGDNLPVRSLQLTGLPEAEARQILLTKGLLNSPDEFDNLIQRYTGNPLALKIVATTIQRLFGGNIQAFLAQGTIVFGDIWQILDQQFSRLAVNEQQLMYWLAIKREWVTIPELEADIIPQISKRELLEALLSLQGRSLIEQQSGSYTQQPVVMEYMTDKLIKQVCQEIISGEINLYNTYALMEATAKDYVSESQKRVILAPILNSLNIIWNNPATITRRLQEIISLLRSKFAAIPGYAAGNTINLLRQLNVDFTGWDFSGLTIWQACLQNINLYQVNFRNSDLRKSNFHQALVNILTVQFSPDGQVLVTGDANGSVRLWNIADGQQLQHLEGHTGWVWQANFSQDGQTLASCCENGIIKLWDVNTGQCLHSYHQESIRSWLSSFSPDNKILASTSREQTIKFWDIHRGECIKTFSEDTHKIGPVAFSPDGQILASGNDYQTVSLWDVNTGECLQTLDEHHQAIWSVSFSPDGQILATGSEDKTVKLWDVSTGRCWQTLQGSQIDLVWAIAFSPDGKTLAIAGEAATISIWDLNTGKCIKTLSGHTTRVWSIAFSPDGHILASGAEDQSIRLWEVNTGRCIKTFHGYPIFTGAVAFSPDGESLASSTGHTVRLWDLATGNLVKNLPGHSRDVMALAYNTDGNTLASGSLDGSIRLWNLSSGEYDKILQEHSSFIFALNYSPNGHRLASGSADKTIKIWDVATGQCLRTLTGHTGWVFSVVWSLDGRFLASMGENSIHLWDAITGENLQVLPGQYCLIGAVAFHPNGQLLATGDNQEYKIQFWDIHTGNSWQTIESHKTTVTDVKFSPNGDRVASGSHDKTIKIWHSQTGEYLQTLQGHSNWIWAIAFHPQGQILASGSQDETVRLWDIATGECLQILRSPRPYQGMNIQGVTGLTPAQKATLKILGARD